MPKVLIHAEIIAKSKGLTETYETLHNIISDSSKLGDMYQESLQKMSSGLNNVIQDFEKMASKTDMTKDKLLDYSNLVKLINLSEKKILKIKKDLFKRLQENNDEYGESLENTEKLNIELKNIEKTEEEIAKQRKNYNAAAKVAGIDGEKLTSKALEHEKERAAIRAKLRKMAKGGKGITADQQRAAALLLEQTDLRKKNTNLMAKEEAIAKKIVIKNDQINNEKRIRLEIDKKITTNVDKRTEGLEETLITMKKVNVEMKKVATSTQVRGAVPGEVLPFVEKGDRTDLDKKSFLGKAAAATMYFAVIQQLRRLISSMVTTIKDFDEALTEVATVTTMNRKEAYALIPAYQELARAVGMTTTEVAKLSIYFFRQGKSMEEALELTKVAAMAAKVAAIDATESANYLTSAINGFGLAADQANLVADKFAALAAKSASSYEELAKAMSKVAPSAKAAGVEIDFMMAFIAKGIETTREAPENIGTAFKTIFARMSQLKDLGKTIEEGMDLNAVETALRAAGVELLDINGTFRDLDDVLVELGKKWNGLERNTKSYIATALAGTRQQTRLLALMENFDRTLELVAASQNSAGAMAEQHAQYIQGLQASVDKLGVSWQKLINNLTDTELIIGAIKLLDKGLQFLDTRFGRILSTSVLLVAGFGILAYSMVKITGAVKETIKGIRVLVGLMKSKIKIDILSTTWLGIKTAAQWLYNLALTATITLMVAELSVALSLATVIGVIVGGVALLGLGIFGVVKLFDAWTRSTKEINADLSIALQTINEINKTVNDLEKLVDRFEELASNTQRTKEETKELLKVMEEIKEIDPSIISDGYKVSSLALKNFLELQKDSLETQEALLKEFSTEAMEDIIAKGMGADKISEEYEGKNIRQMEKFFLEDVFNIDELSETGQQAADILMFNFHDKLIENAKEIGKNQFFRTMLGKLFVSEETKEALKEQEAFKKLINDKVELLESISGAMKEDSLESLVLAGSKIAELKDSTDETEQRQYEFLKDTYGYLVRINDLSKEIDINLFKDMDPTEFLGMANTFDEIAESIKGEDYLELSTAMLNTYGAALASTENKFDAIDAVVKEHNLTLEKQRDLYKELTDDLSGKFINQIQNLSSKYKKLSDIIIKSAKGETLSMDELVYLATNYPGMMDRIIDGSITATEALEEQKQAVGKLADEVIDGAEREVTALKELIKTEEKKEEPDQDLIDSSNKQLQIAEDQIITYKYLQKAILTNAQANYILTESQKANLKISKADALQKYYTEYKKLLNAQIKVGILDEKSIKSAKSEIDKANEIILDSIKDKIDDRKTLYEEAKKDLEKSFSDYYIIDPESGLIIIDEDQISKLEGVRDVFEELVDAANKANLEITQAQQDLIEAYLEQKKVLEEQVKEQEEAIKKAFQDKKDILNVEKDILAVREKMFDIEEKIANQAALMQQAGRLGASIGIEAQFKSESLRQDLMKASRELEKEIFDVQFKAQMDALESAEQAEINQLSRNLTKEIKTLDDTVGKNNELLGFGNNEQDKANKLTEKQTKAIIDANRINKWGLNMGTGTLERSIGR